MAILTVIHVALNYFIRRIDILKKEGFILALNAEILKYIFKVETKGINEHESTYLHSRVLEDSATVTNFLFVTLSEFICNIFLLIIAAVVLYRVNSVILLSLVIFLPIYTLIYMFFREKIFYSSKEVREASNDCFATRNSVYSNYIDVKIRKRELAEIKRLSKKENILMTSLSKNFLLHFTLSTVKISTHSFFQFLGFTLGGLAVLKGHITLGIFTYMIQYFTKMLSTVETFLDIGTSYQNYKVSTTRLNEILSINYELDGDKSIEEVESVELINVNYKYCDADNDLYKNGITFKLARNNLYTLVGENGVGKSTLFMLLTGIYKDNNLKGEILINGHPISNLNMSLFREQCVSVMLQNTSLLGVTVQEYLMTFTDLSGLQTFVKKEYYKDVFMSNEFNINDFMDLQFDNLSGGEKQLINLLACLIKNVNFYILDEPIANIFPHLRDKIIDLLVSMTKEGKIILISTHNQKLSSKGTLCIIE